MHSQILNTFYYLLHPSITHFQFFKLIFNAHVQHLLHLKSCATNSKQLFVEQVDLNRMRQWWMNYSTTFLM